MSVPLVRNSYIEKLPEEIRILIVESFTRYLQSKVVRKLVKALFHKASLFIDVLPSAFHTLKLSGKWSIDRAQNGLILQIGDLEDKSLIARIVAVLGKSVKTIVTTKKFYGAPETLLRLLRKHCQQVTHLSVEQAVDRFMYKALNYKLISHYAPTLIGFTFIGCWPTNKYQDWQRIDACKVCNLLLESSTLSLVQLKFTVQFMKTVPAILKRCASTLEEVDLGCREEFNDNKFIEIAWILRTKCRRLTTVRVPPFLGSQFMAITADLYMSYKENLVTANIPMRMTEFYCERFLTACPNTKCTTLVVVPFTNRLLTIRRHLRSLQLVGTNDVSWQDVPECLNACPELIGMEVSTVIGQELSADNVDYIFQSKLQNLSNLKLSFVWPNSLPLDIIGKSTGSLIECHIQVSNLDSGDKMFEHVIARNPTLKAMIISEKRNDKPERNAQDCENLTMKLVESFRSCKELEAFYVSMVGPNPRNEDNVYKKCELMFCQQVVFVLQYEGK